MSGDCKFQIVPMTLEHTASVAALHLKALPTSILSRLGYAFLNDFYYKEILRVSTFSGFVILFENQVAGFIALALPPGSIFRILFLRSFFKLARVMFCSLLRDIRVLSPLSSAAVFLLKGTEHREEDAAEILSFAVAEEFRSLDFFRKTGIKRLANLLFKFALDHLKAEGARKVFLMVETNNALARVFYKSMGFKETATQNYFGLDCLKCEKSLADIST